MISMYHDTKMEKVVTFQKEEQQKWIQKQVCVLHYKKHTGNDNHYCTTLRLKKKTVHKLSAV